MNDDQWEFLTRLIETPAPSGYELQAQQVWRDYVADFADTVEFDEYGNVSATIKRSRPEIVLTGHSDEIGMIVRRIDDDGFIHPAPIGGVDKTVTRGQQVQVHTKSGPITGVVGQTAIHLREENETNDKFINDFRIDVGASDGDEARALIEIGDSITFADRVERLQGSRIAGRGLDDRVGTLAAAEGLRAAAAGTGETTVTAVSTVQEEIGLQGAKMMGFDLSPDAVIGIDVCHALDYPDAPTDTASDISLGEGPVITRGSSNHPALVQLAMEAADNAGISVQIRAAGSGTGTDIDAVYTQLGGIPSVTVGIPTRYMHTPVEVIDTTDLTELITLLEEMTTVAASYDSFSLSFD